MADKLFSKYMWLVDTIRSGRFTSEQIRRKWATSSLNEKGNVLSKRTFYKWLQAAQETFDISIENEHCGSYCYYIENEEVLNQNSLRKWLLSTFSTSTLLMDSMDLRDRILAEETPSTDLFLADVLRAMRDGNALHVTYRSFAKDTNSEFDIEPYCVKLFNRRWYVYGRIIEWDNCRILSLDRIVALSQLPDKRFSLPADFSAAAFFSNFFGVFINEDIDIETVRLKVRGDEVKYLRSLPLHHSQKETVTTPEYSIFTYRLRPQFDFVQAVIAKLGNVELLSPAWLRSQVTDYVTDLWNIYKTENKPL